MLLPACRLPPAALGICRRQSHLSGPGFHRRNPSAAPRGRSTGGAGRSRASRGGRDRRPSTAGLAWPRHFSHRTHAWILDRVKAGGSSHAVGGLLSSPRPVSPPPQVLAPPAGAPCIGRPCLFDLGAAHCFKGTGLQAACVCTERWCLAGPAKAARHCSVAPPLSAENAAFGADSVMTHSRWRLASCFSAPPQGRRTAVTQPSRSL